MIFDVDLESAKNILQTTLFRMKWKEARDEGTGNS